MIKKPLKEENANTSKNNEKSIFLDNLLIIILNLFFLSIC